MTEINNTNPTKGRRAAAVIAGSALTLSTVAFGVPAAFAENAQSPQQAVETQATDHEQPNEVGKLQITPSATEVRAGDSFIVHGTGFTPNEDVQLRTGNEILSNERADENGDIAAEVDIRDDFETGAHSLAAVDYGGDEAAYADFEVLEKLEETEVDPEVELESDELAPGDSLRSSGTGFTPEGGVSFKVHIEGRNFEGGVNADENGDVSDSITVPEGTGDGSYELVVTDKETGEQESEEFTVASDDSQDSHDQDHKRGDDKNDDHGDD